MGDFWDRISGIIDGKNIKISADSEGTPIANPVRGFLAAVYTLTEQTTEYAESEGEDGDAPEDVPHSLNGLVKQIEAYAAIDLSAFRYEGTEPTIGEIDRKAHQLKAFLIGCYSTDA